MNTRLEFGEWLRRQRERRGISLSAIADQTKISASLFAALERGDCSRWPAGIYSRSWIRNYATVIGLDPDDVGEQFTRCFAETAFPDPQPEPAPTRVQQWIARLRGLLRRPAGDGDRQIPVGERLVAGNVGRQNAKRVVSRRKRRRVERAVRRDAIA